MSHNIVISAIRTVRFDRPDGTEGTDTQSVYFDAWQTPTGVTREIVTASDPLAVYINWITVNDAMVSDPVYAEDDIWCEREPVDTKEYWRGRAHIAELLEWIESVKSRGFTVQWESN